MSGDIDGPNYMDYEDPSQRVTSHQKLLKLMLRECYNYRNGNPAPCINIILCSHVYIVCEIVKYKKFNAYLVESFLVSRVDSLGIRYYHNSINSPRMPR